MDGHLVEGLKVAVFYALQVSFGSFTGRSTKHGTMSAADAKGSAGKVRCFMFN
jgi:hypothetical protein